MLRHRRGQAVLRRAHPMRRRDGEQLQLRGGGVEWRISSTNLSLTHLLPHLCPSHSSFLYSVDMVDIAPEMEKRAEWAARPVQPIVPFPV